MADVRRGWARQMARNLLRKYDVTTPGSPVESIIQQEGLKIVRMDWPNRVSGLTLKQDSRTVIGVNKNHPLTRQRFTLSHEFGHNALGHEQLETVQVDLDDPPDPGEQYAYDSEREANEFAGELLVPMKILKQVHRTEKDPHKLSDLFQVSAEVMFIALQKHHLL